MMAAKKGMLWLRPCALVATIHDLAPFRLANKYDWKGTFYRRVVARSLAHRQDEIIAVSQHTGRDILEPLSYVSTLAATLVATGLLAVPSAQAAGVCIDSVTAGGWVEVGTDLFANFGLNAKSETRGEDAPELTGQLDFVNADETCHVVGFEVLTYTVLDEFCREIEYAVTITHNGVSEEGTALVTVCDTGETPGSDSFGIEVFDSEELPVPDCSVPLLPLANGDVQIHVYGNCN
jgi:hypothetical protein